jgi:hypothetical protein
MRPDASMTSSVLRWGRGAVGSAPRWHRGGRGFESHRLHQFWFLFSTTYHNFQGAIRGRAVGRQPHRLHQLTSSFQCDSKLLEERYTPIGVSQEEFVDLCEPDRTYIEGTERGERNVGLVKIEKLARALKSPFPYCSRVFEASPPGVVYQMVVKCDRASADF